jgi:Leucine-rich repeat (LRR) protein
VIPPEITRLTKLQFLGLYRNSLCVHLPAGFGNLMKLQYFHASENNLTGNLSEVRSLTQLVSLYLSFNNFSGEVPGPKVWRI